MKVLKIEQREDKRMYLEIEVDGAQFEEAMENMLAWEFFDEIPKTEGLNRLVNCYDNGKFPGLGVIKRYSLMHHMQIISELLGDE